MSTSRAKWNLFIASALSLMAIGPLSADAASRTVYFNAVGTNRTQDGLADDVNSTCKITISNPSSQTETWSIETTATSIDPWTSATPQGVKSSASSSGCFTGCSLAANGSVTLTYTYKNFPKRDTVHTAAGAPWAYAQQLRCSGKITVSDAGTQPGFLIANGVLVTFVESSRMHTDAATGGTATFAGIAVWTQIPIAINRSKPF
jgi:hypothetical protein